MKAIIVSFMLLCGCQSIKSKVEVFDSYSKGVSVGKTKKMKVFLIFDAYSNPTNSTSKLLNQEEIQSLLSKYIVIHLRVDGTDSDSKTNGKLQLEKFRTSYQPCYFILTENEEIIKGPLGYSNIDQLLDFIKL